MLRAFVLLALLLSAPTSARAAIPYGSACGVFRWSVKTLADPAAARLTQTPTTTTIAALVQLRSPGDPQYFTARKPPVETTFYHVRARLQGYVLEDDGDIHLLLRDPQTGAHMIGEIPAPYCAPHRRAAAFADARAAVDKIGRHAARPNRIWWLDYRGATPPLVDVWGYGYWDDEHGQRGAARNGVELHPVLRLRCTTCTSAQDALRLRCTTCTSAQDDKNDVRAPPLVLRLRCTTCTSAQDDKLHVISSGGARRRSREA